jgi:signal transduction histidine kinase
MRRRLFGLVIATTSLVLVAFLVPLALLVRSVAADRAVGSALVDVQSFAAVVAATNTDQLADVVAQTNTSAAHPITVFLPGGGTIGVSAARSAAVDRAATGQSLTADAPGGREVLVAVAGLPSGTVVLRTFVSDGELSRGVGRAWLVLGLLGLGLLLVSAAVADQLSRAVTRPLTVVAQAARRLAGGELDARAEPAGPAEVREVGRGLNQLAGRIGDMIVRERETVADLSHRLRTPLTALRIDAESLIDPDDRARLTADVDALERTVDAVIRSARRPAHPGEVACDAVRVVADRVGYWSALADEEGRSIRVDLAARPVPVRVGADELAACVDALLGNVFAHTPPGVGCTVSLGPLSTGGGRLLVEDDGPGLPGPAVLRRGASGGGSTGLGLDIVRRTAAHSGGAMLLGRSYSGGALIAVDLGPPG